MCNIIEYGFTLNDSSSLSGPTCKGIITDTLGASVSISFDASDIGKTYIAAVSVMYNGISKGVFKSDPKYSGGLTLWTFKIPFTGLIPQAGTYTFGGGGCASIHSPDMSSQYCYKCETTKCTSLTICAPVWACETPLNGYEADGCGHRRPNSNCNPQKWKCSNAATNMCVQASDGIYDTEATCKASSTCQPSQPPTNNTLIYIGLAAAGVAVLYMSMKKK